MVRPGECQKRLTNPPFPTLTFFNAIASVQLDDDNSGEVDVQELADPLLSTGIAKTMIEVVDLIREVDRDDTGEIGFEEFLQIMKPNEANKAKKSR